MVSQDCEAMMLKKQILEFVIKNWKAILIVSLLAIVVLKNKKDYSLMQKAYETQAESHQAQIEGLKEIHKRQMQEKQLLMESHLESLAVIEQDYENAIEMIDQLRRDKKGDYKNKFNQDREQLIKDIERTFGIQYVP